MAREISERLSCDVCSSDRGVKTYTVTGNSKTVVTDVCREHGAAFETALRKGDTGPRRSPSRIANRPTHSVVPID
jgi:hypothetical protein